MYSLCLFEQIGPYNFVRVQTTRYDSLFQARFDAERTVADRVRIMSWDDQILNEWVDGEPVS